MYTVHMNIYISKAVMPHLKGEENKSGLINDLLLRHYGLNQSSQHSRHYPERKGLESKKNSEQIRIEHTPNDGTPFNKGLDMTSDLFKPDLPEGAEVLSGADSLEMAREQNPAPYQGKHCCTLKRPCQHWQYQPEKQIWVNVLTGEEKEIAE